MPKRSFYVKDSELDDYQVKIINKRTDNSFIVKGCAGSGKSILALWKAKQIQNEGRGSYQFIVFTKALMQYMSDGVRQVGINSSMKPDIGKDFYSDSSVFFHIEKMIPQKLRKPFKTDLDWFQEEYIKGPSSQYYAKALRDNPSVIDSFERYISKKKYAKQIEVESIVRNLKELYLK